MRDRERIEKLLRLYRNVPDTPEGRNAHRHAQRLMARSGWTEADFVLKKESTSRVFAGPSDWGNPIDFQNFFRMERTDPPKDFDETVHRIVESFHKLFTR